MMDFVILAVVSVCVIGVWAYLRSQPEAEWLHTWAAYEAFRPDCSLVRGEMLVADDMDDQDLVQYVHRRLVGDGIITPGEYYKLTVRRLS